MQMPTSLHNHPPRFSDADFKRLVSEQVSGICDQGMIKEVIGRIEAFNYYKNVRAKMIGVTSTGVAVV